MILINADIDSLVRVEDMFLIDASGVTCVDGSGVDKIEIKADISDDFVEVYDSQIPLNLGETREDSKVMIWAYERSGPKEVTIKATKGVDERERVYSVECVEDIDDIHFSNDNDLLVHEPQIKSFLPFGRSSFLYLHREVKREILRVLKEISKDIDFTMLYDRSEFIAWSKYRTLELIFESRIAEDDDLNTAKRNTYKELVSTSRDQVKYTLDTDKDGSADKEVSTRPLTLRLG